MRTPLIIAGPGIPRGKSTRRLYLSARSFPDPLRRDRHRASADLEGESLRPIWEGKKARIRDSVFLPFIQIQRAVRDERWKLIAYPQIGHLQLFDLQTDPHEKTNLIDRPEYAKHVGRLRQLMSQWQARVGDTLELPMENKPPPKVDLTDRERKPDEWQPDWIIEKYFGGNGEGKK